MYVNCWYLLSSLSTRSMFFFMRSLSMKSWKLLCLRLNDLPFLLDQPAWMLAFLTKTLSWQAAWRLTSIWIFIPAVPARHQVIRPSPQAQHNPGIHPVNDMEFENLLGLVIWMFNVSAFFTEAACGVDSWKMQLASSSVSVTGGLGQAIALTGRSTFTRPAAMSRTSLMRSEAG